MASIRAFQPYGLIKTPIEAALYRNAHIANIYTGIADPKEHETTALMLTILYSNVFTTRENFAVNSEQPPNPNTKTRCDIVIRYLESGSEELRALCFAECKRASMNQPFSLKALEEQAFEYSKTYLRYHKMPFVYAATMAGAHVRLWGCRPEMDEMEPFWGSWTAGDWSQYKDVGHDADVLLIESGFTRMKQFPPSAHAGQTSETYGTSGITSSTTLGFPANYTIPSRITAQSGFPAAYGVPDYTTGRPGFPAASGYARPGFPVTSSLASYTTTPTEFPTAGASFSSGVGAYTVSYSTATLSPSMHPDLDSIQKPTVQTSEASEGKQEEDDQYKQDKAQHGQASGDTGGQHGTASNTGSKYTVVRVNRVSHKLGSDDFVFNDSKGRSRTTKRTDWKKITYNGASAWKYSHYICLENHFK